MSDNKIKKVTARVIFISDGHITEVEAALTESHACGFTDDYLANRSTKDIHDEIVGQTFAAGAVQYKPCEKSGSNHEYLNSINNQPLPKGGRIKNE